MKLPRVHLVLLRAELRVIVHGALAMALTLTEFAFVHFAVGPLLDSLACDFTVKEFSAVS
jgi:hypothetical protein